MPRILPLLSGVCFQVIITHRFFWNLLAWVDCYKNDQHQVMSKGKKFLIQNIEAALSLRGTIKTFIGHKTAAFVCFPCPFSQAAMNITHVDGIINQPRLSNTGMPMEHLQWLLMLRYVFCSYDV